jgi:hypothetical protein
MTQKQKQQLGVTASIWWVMMFKEQYDPEPEDMMP